MRRDEDMMLLTPREVYWERMRKLPQFRHFGIEPEWRPGEKDVEGFCHDEIVRQFHDPRVPYDGGCRVTWMKQAWAYARVQANGGDPTAQDIVDLGSLVEQKENKDGFRIHNVQIGNRRGAPPEMIPTFVDTLVRQLPVAEENYQVGFDVNRASHETFLNDVRRVRTADDWYLAYEFIHPFGDGNGRTGKILHNWLMGTLDDPVLIRDYFGGGNP